VPNIGSRQDEKRIRNAVKVERTLQFESIESLSPKIVEYIGALVSNLGDAELLDPPAKAQRKEDDIYGYDDSEFRMFEKDEPEVYVSKQYQQNVYFVKFDGPSTAKRTKMKDDLLSARVESKYNL
jgi:hypothetical protein